jgi:hypothetical protein
MDIRGVRAYLSLMETSIQSSRKVATDLKQSHDHEEQKFGRASLSATNQIENTFVSFKEVLEQYLNEEEQKHA